jgi:nickel-dependent lactate racemase
VLPATSNRERRITALTTRTPITSQLADLVKLLAAKHRGLTVLTAAGAETIAIDAIAAAVERALQAPLDYAPLGEATVPGDQIAVAVDCDIPQVDRVLQGVQAALLAAGVYPSQVQVVLAPQFAHYPNLVQHIREALATEVVVTIHCSEDPDHLGLVAITAAGEPLRLNRALSEADLVISLRGTRPASFWQNLGGALFPAFSDHESQSRFHPPQNRLTPDAQDELQQECQECDWLLGVGFAVHIVPGPADTVAGVVCGTPTAAADAAAELYRRVWQVETPTAADLVVAMLVGDPSQQTWDNLARAAAIAEPLLKPGGAIAVCSTLATRPGPSIRRLRNAADLDALQRRLSSETAADSHAAWLLCGALQRGTVYLESQLDTDVVESLGFAPLSTVEELQRLIEHAASCLILEQAQHLEPVPTG